MTRSKMLPAIILAALALAACDQGSSGITDPENEAVVVGQVTSESASMQSAPPSGPALQTQGGATASTVVIGQLSSSGGFSALAEAEVNAQGQYRIEGVPSGRTELVVIARTEADAEVGRVVLHEETRAGREHRAHPIDARSTFHGKVWAQMKANGQGNMGSAELSLFMDVRSDVAASAVASQSTVAQAATGAARAEAAITAVLEREGVPMSATARNLLLLALAADRDDARAAGASMEVTQRTYVEAAIDAFADAGVSLEALAMAHAAAGTSIRQEVETAEEGARREVVRTAILLSIEVRKKLVASVQGNALGLKSGAQGHLALLEAQVRSASTYAELQATVRAEREEAEERMVSGILTALASLPLATRLEVEAALSAALEGAQFWAHTNGATSAAAMANAAAEFRSQVTTRAQAALEAIPSTARGDLTAAVMVSILIAIGAGAAV